MTGRLREEIWGAGAGITGVAFFVAAVMPLAGRPGFNAPGDEIAAYLATEETQVQLACALFAISAPLLIWFFATVSSLARRVGGAAETAARTAFGCGVSFVCLYLVDITALAVGAFRPRTMVEAPELAVLMHDFEWVTIAIATPLPAAMMAAYAVIALRGGALWPRWLGWWAAAAAVLYPMRLGSLFTTTGPFASDGLLALIVPLSMICSWLVAASIVLVVRLRGRDPNGLLAT